MVYYGAFYIDPVAFQNATLDSGEVVCLNRRADRPQISNEDRCA